MLDCLTAHFPVFAPGTPSWNNSSTMAGKRLVSMIFGLISLLRRNCMEQQEILDSRQRQVLTIRDRTSVSVPTRQAMRAVAAAWDALMAGEERGLEHGRPSIRASW